ncbi:MAG TPA: complex I NDUFA9 subunit family protein [Stellaceae bacterium]
MNNRRVTIVGGAGLTGRNIVKRLAARGAVITVASRNAVAAGFLRPMGDVGQIAPFDVGIADGAMLARLIAGRDTVISCAGILAEHGRNSFDLVHHRGPAMLARLAAEAGVRRFVHVSAIGADPRSPSAYARSKAAGEASVLAAFPGATIMRPSLIFGPEDGAFNLFGAMARALPALPLIGGGRTRFQPVFVDNVADAIVAVLDRPEAEGRIYELGGPEILTFRQMLELLLRVVRRPRALVPVPAGLASFLAYFLEFLPDPPLTRDQIKLLQIDNVVGPGMPGLAELGVAPAALGLVLPTYLDRFRKGGRFPPMVEAANRLT